MHPPRFVAQLGACVLGFTLYYYSPAGSSGSDTGGANILQAEAAEYCSEKFELATCKWWFATPKMEEDGQSGPGFLPE
jgi:hypothetical protein